MKITRLKTIKSATNSGSPTKIAVDLLENEGYKSVVVMTKLILVNNESVLELMSIGYIRLKRLKNKTLMFCSFGLKIPELKEIVGCLSEEVIEHETHECHE